ncbi:regulatory protein RecX [Corynebacterium sp. P3-F1]|uniref:regulatory protein RecX n=1 Tax=Corynebacterium sp. P3-F1 TaxID=3059080 RepID=UPI00265CC9E4|nr:regulatory protein RecX [Corynebacterium sp. P3-F1]WKK61707.1 regulatory protein RecX [Corynebacterium sp. P3-F1]
MPERREPDPEKIHRLQEALDAYAAGGGTGLIDHEHEKAAAKVRERALRLLDQRARSRHELRDRLLDPRRVKEGEDAPDPDLVDDVLDALERAGLIDDKAFAQQWVRQRFERRGKSSAVLRRELQEKGVSAANRENALSLIDERDEQQLARTLARKKARSVKTVPADRTARDKELRRIVGVLARRGFPQSMALEIGKDALDERCRELESGL